TSTSDAWTDDLPSGTFACQSICTDGTSVYAVFIDTNASPDEYHIQAWDIETWDVKSGWGSTGTQLTLASDAAVHKVIIANSSYLAVINDTQGITVAGSAAIEIIDITDGSLDADGAGDATTGVGDDVKADPCIVSDGTNLFFCVYKTSTTNLYLCSATIADPTTGSGGSNYPLNTNQNAHCGGMTGAGTGAVALLNHVSADAHDDVVLYTFDASDADLAKIERGQNANSIVCDEYVYEDCNDMVFDGINIWAFVLIQNPTDRMALLKIDSSKLIWDEQEGGDKYLDDINPSLFLLPAGHTALGSPQMGLTFDGRDVWSLVEHSASQTLSGKIVRLPLGLIRS
ncbi:MAG: hypothetical protein GWN96_06495, partial [candidate division Zixibacteria bacterium]|nr:hypothetical protein [candidate division Zixibacteria bacterium]